MKFSIFKNSGVKTPYDTIALEDFILMIKGGEWKKQIVDLRTKSDEKAYKRKKMGLPAVTMSGEFKSRDKHLDLKDKLKNHTGILCLDVDKKDNPKMRTKDLIDRECLFQFVSCGGEGVKIGYRCQKTKDAAEHRRIFDAAVLRLQKKGIKIKVDPIVKSIASLQYVSYDPEAAYFPKSKLVIKPLPAPKVEKRKPTEDVVSELQQLGEYIDALGDKDVTRNYEDWLAIAFGLTESLGEHGREAFHKISSNYDDYDEGECNEMYDTCLERKGTKAAEERPVTISSVYQILISGIPKVKLRTLAKKYNKGHAVGVGEDVEQGDLAGLVRYKLFLFKKIFDKEDNQIKDLVPHGINLNEFEALLKSKGFYRFDNKFVHIVDNIVEQVDADDILRIVTRHIEAEGDYKFSYMKIEYTFSWEELVHLWRSIRAQGTTYNQITASLEHWKPNLLRDTAVDSFIPYQNGVLHVSANKIQLLPYNAIPQQIWKERILPRPFTYVEKPGMFEEFFANVCGRGKDRKQRIASEQYKRALWYYGYMLQGAKRQSTARAWLLYDIKTGNNGRSGKTILGQAVGKIRSMVTLDGKQIDFKNRFAFQTVLDFTEVVFIDDPSKYMSLNPLFNMITGDLHADKKGTEPLVKSVKFMIASNWILESEGSSEAGRQFVTQLDDFYVRYSKEHGNTITPIVDLHGKEFFTDWDADDWAKFDSFSARALQYHLKAESPANTIIGNSAAVRFIQIYEEEMFFELASTFCNHVARGRDGTLLIVQPLLTGVIREHDQQLKANKAGKIAREFLACIGGKDIEITSVPVAGQAKMAYKLHNQFNDLNFGGIAKSLPKPKL